MYMVVPGTFGQVGHLQAPLTGQLGYSGDEGPVLVGEPTNSGVREPYLFSDIRSDEYVHRRMVRSARIEGEAEVTQGVGTVHPGEHVHGVCIDCYTVQLLKVFRHPLVVAVEPCEPLCVHRLKQGATCPSSTLTIDIVDHVNGGRTKRLCYHGSQGPVE